MTVLLISGVTVPARGEGMRPRGPRIRPNGLGKSLRVVVFAKGDQAGEAADAGADEVGGEELAAKIKDGWLDFDVCIAAPDMMGMVELVLADGIFSV